MGYTTKFKGTLQIEPQPSQELIETINSFSKVRHDEEYFPGIWCQWIIDEDGQLCWNGGEKFYKYSEWLEYLIENFFVPNNYVINGRIYFRGERFEDMGIIYVEENRVKVLSDLLELSEDEIIVVISMNSDGKVIIETMH